MIVKVTSYTRIRKAAKATIRYIMHRPNEEGERVSRDLFGSDGPMGKYHGYWMVDTAPRGSIFYRVALSPDPLKEDTNKDLNLEWMTQVAMRYMKEKLGKDVQFLATAHDDQTPVRHVNALVVMPGRLTNEEFRKFPKLLKSAAEVEVKLQRQVLDPQPEPYLFQRAVSYATPDFQPSYMDNRGSSPLADLHSCPSCGPSQPLWKVADDQFKCPSCGFRYEALSSPGGLQREGAHLSL